MSCLGCFGLNDDDPDDDPDDDLDDDAYVNEDNKEGTRRRNMQSRTLYLGSFLDESLLGREKRHWHRKSTRTKMIRTKVSDCSFLW
jgi:hypothetical protein